ncbi:mitochondrial ATP synthase g subunit-domain-containing protein [Pisolithus marmoratus]|nr:mitochondrial ATP synthase g subunit-domain-containing protein [Pisolithus marmoratus]
MLRLARSFRPSRTRFASTSTQQKAQETLTKALEYTKRTLTPVGDRVGVALGSYRQPLLYNLSVARELLKQIYIAESLAPPRSFSTVFDAYSTLWTRVRDVGYWRTILSNGEWARVGVYAVEAYGIFKIGEILGRRNLVGYDLH